MSTPTARPRRVRLCPMLVPAQRVPPTGGLSSGEAQFQRFPGVPLDCAVVCLLQCEYILFCLVC